jgi:hypothetical protein
MTIQSEQEALSALDRISTELSTPRKSDLGSLCATYRTIKPFLAGVIFLVERIPKVGKKIADAIRFLMSVADVACPAG